MSSALHILTVVAPQAHNRFELRSKVANELGHEIGAVANHWAARAGLAGLGATGLGLGAYHFGASRERKRNAEALRSEQEKAQQEKLLAFGGGLAAGMAGPRLNGATRGLVHRSTAPTLNDLDYAYGDYNQAPPGPVPEYGGMS